MQRRLLMAGITFLLTVAGLMSVRQQDPSPLLNITAMVRSAGNPDGGFESYELQIEGRPGCTVIGAAENPIIAWLRGGENRRVTLVGVRE